MSVVLISTVRDCRIIRGSIFLSVFCRDWVKELLGSRRVYIKEETRGQMRLGNAGLDKAV